MTVGKAMMSLKVLQQSEQQGSHFFWVRDEAVSGSEIEEVYIWLLAIW